MRRLASIVATLSAAAALVLSAQPASFAESTVVVDPRGDAEHDSRDIYRVAIDHTQQQVRIRLNQDMVPDLYYIRVDVPGGRKWDYMVLWSYYYQRTMTIKTRRQFEADDGSNTCQRHSSTTPGRAIQLRVPRSCLGDPAEVAVQAFAYDESYGLTDHTLFSHSVRSN